jgi:hypothetical protein
LLRRSLSFFIKIVYILINDPPPKRLFVGFDHLGAALELIAIDDDEQDRLLVFHAMKLRKIYHYLLEEGNHEL